MKRFVLAAAVVSIVAGAARADEGMWTYDNFPVEAVAKKYGFRPSPQWLEQARLSSVRLAQGCSGSFVSPDGLVMTNHHCAQRCIQQLSTKERNYLEHGFYAAQPEHELKCPELELNQLQQITDVSDRIDRATKGLSGEKFTDAQNAEKARVEKEACGGDEALRCDVVNLYHGGKYHLYKYRRLQDVRLVFAPEFDIAFFGGDPDNFMFPRYDLDLAFLRAYENDKPIKSESYFRWSQSGAREGELTFVSGHPGSTSREVSISKLKFLRDTQLPERLMTLAEWRGALTQWTRQSPEHARWGETDLFGVENSYKKFRGSYAAISDETLFKSKVDRENQLRARVKASPELSKLVGPAWQELDRALELWKQRRLEYQYVEKGDGFNGRLFGFARTLVRGTEEVAKPLEKRLPEYADSKLPALKQRLFSKAPVYEELETFKLTHFLTKMREDLGPDHPFVKKVLKDKSPAELARALVAGTKLRDREFRKKLWEGGKAAVDAVRDDSFFELVRMIEPEARAIRKWHDDEIEAREDKASRAIALARLRLEKGNVYPDATFTLRLSYGAVKGYTQKDGRKVPPLTQFAGAWERQDANGAKDPFKLPESWTGAKDRVNAGTPFNFVTTNDIIGGNSGSPIFNKELEIVGLVFDGNIESLGGDFWFDESVNRAVGVHSVGMMEALEKVYGAKRIVGELKANQKGAPGAGMK